VRLTDRWGGGGLGCSLKPPPPPPLRRTPPRSIRERIATEEAAKEAALIAQFLDKCAEDDRREQAARHAREVARAVS